MTRFKLNGYLEGYQPNDVCLIYGNDDKCFGVDDSASRIEKTLSGLNARTRRNY